MDKAGLPAATVNRLIRLASFQNPEFYRFQAMRLSTFGKPRIICCTEDTGTRISLPRGCLPALGSFLESSGALVEVVDDRFEGVPLKGTFESELSCQQKQALTAILEIFRVRPA